ncbi:uncharacterized protein LOC114294374 [Camellia sinensis]|uniref:uncharacterized protein LOC114294374 n=1 Tax=Camellia sinensis TaxID=4442 RepID=UPI00103687C6|nr:uncharacterized protein LOC114294374 [Camellia sinensis]
MWSVHARVLHANGFFYVRKWNGLHTCGVSVRTPKNPRVGSDLVSDVISERVRDKPLTRPTDVVYDLKKDYGLEVSYRVAWLGVEKARGEMFGTHSISFDQLRWYSDAVMTNNPGSYINIEYDEQHNHFSRYFISFKACIDGFAYYRPMLFLDGTFLKEKFKGNLLAATAKDGNQVVAFNEKLEEFMKASPKVAPAFLKDLPPQYWANAHFRYTVTTFNFTKFILCHAHNATLYISVQQSHCIYPTSGARYGEMSSNAVESFNSWIREARHLPITQLVDSIQTKIIRQMSKRRLKVQSWPGVVCPKMEDRLVKAYNKGRSWLLSQSNNEIFEVHSFPSVMVDVGRRTCSCFHWQIKGFPCAHTVVAIGNSGLDLYDLVDSYYHVSKYRNSYACNIHHTHG